MPRRRAADGLFAGEEPEMVTVLTWGLDGESQPDEHWGTELLVHDDVDAGQPCPQDPLQVLGDGTPGAYIDVADSAYRCPTWSATTSTHPTRESRGDGPGSQDVEARRSTMGGPVPVGTSVDTLDAGTPAQGVDGPQRWVTRQQPCAGIRCRGIAS